MKYEEADIGHNGTGKGRIVQIKRAGQGLNLTARIMIEENQPIFLSPSLLFKLPAFFFLECKKAILPATN